MVRSRNIIVTIRQLLLPVVALLLTETAVITITVSAFSSVVPRQQQQQRRPSQPLPLHSINNLFHAPTQEVSVLSTSNAHSSLTSCGWKSEWTQHLATVALGIALLVAPNMALAENELSAKYGNNGFDTSLVDQTCLLDHCSLQAKACLQDDPDCRKGLTCTAKCMGDNACITGCMARYGDAQLDSLLKCTIEDHECIKVAILPGGSDAFGEEPKSPAPTISNFDVRSMQGSWYKVVGYNPNYDCYACQRNTFNIPTSSSTSGSSSSNTLQMDVEFSMPHLLPDGSPLPPSAGVRETLNILYDDENNDDASNSAITLTGLKSMALNDYHTNEIMVFDTAPPLNHQNPWSSLVLHPGTDLEQSYSRTAHSEGEMFGLKFWENWYIIGENDNDMSEEFKFVYYNGKTRQNTYEGAFVYSRTKDLSPESMKKVYQIAQEAGMDPNQFCRIRNGCFPDDNSNVIRKDVNTGWGSPNNPFRGILASTRVSELLGVEPVAARDMLLRNTPTAPVLTPEPSSPVAGSSAGVPTTAARHWWYEVGDYLENPHRHFEAMSQLRQPMVWPRDVVDASVSR